MPKDILLRSLPDSFGRWLEQNLPSGVSQAEFLRNVLVREAENSDFQSDLFADAKEPQKVYGRLPFKFIDLFAGIGGFRCAMTSLGGQCVFTSEWDKYSARTYQSWYSDDHVHTGDIRNIDITADIPDHDVLCAGFPCQPFSLAGVSKKQSMGRAHGFEDEKQGNLFFSILNIVDAKRPAVLMLENVKNLMSHDKGNTWKVIRTELDSRNYSVHAKIVDAQGWVPQHRERIFLVCFDNDIFDRVDQGTFQFPEADRSTKPDLSSILSSKAPDKKYMLSDKLWLYLQNYAEKHRLKGNGFGFGLFGKKDVARTLSARYHKDGSEILIKQPRWRNPRRLTPDEARQLMGFTDEYALMFGHENGFPQVVSDTQAYRQFGNAVVPLVVESIARGIIDVMAHRLTMDNECLMKGRQVLKTEARMESGARSKVSESGARRKSKLEVVA
jgi:DNA (cytosine-5)-methyltransferase 1